MYVISRRIGFYILTAIAAVTVDFFIPRVMPGNPVSALVCFELFVRQIVDLIGIGLVVAEHLRGHVDARKLIPERKFSFVFRIPEYAPGVRRFPESCGVIKQRIGAPDERNAVSLSVYFYERRVAKLCGELTVNREFGKIERCGEPCS